MTAAARHYRAIFDSRTPAELRELAHIKRFMERLTGDEAFRNELASHAADPAPLAARYGIDLDLRQALPLWHRSYLQFRMSPDIGNWPLAARWNGYMAQMLRHRDMLRDEGCMTDANPRFERWRQRQINRCMSELGGSASAITHPIIAFELSRGCTVGCWFCGLSAPKFRDYFPYTDENAALWQGMLSQTVSLFGQAARTGFCYWATDPCDNPDYDRFIHDYWKITGALPQTTTAAPLKDIALTRRILALFDAHKTVTNRFSIITLRQLNRVHDAFSPEELMGVELVMQNKESLSCKAFAGRAQERRDRLRAAGKSDQIALLTADHTTIACVSGFLVNMPERSVQLIAPVPASQRWPRGYRIYGESHFTCPDTFRAALVMLMDQHMLDGMPAHQTIRFRPDLRFEALDDGFRLHSRVRSHTMRLGPEARQLGELLRTGTTRDDLIGRMLDARVDIFTTVSMLDAVFDASLLQEHEANEPFINAFLH
jgi:radical SAM family RiPP maturation amino acid epimerase